MIKRVIVFSWLLAAFFNSDLFSQSKLENRNNFYEAESWILFEDYKEALPIYLQLLQIYPDNSNIKYRVGLCYISTPGEKEKAINYLEDAVKNINPKYREGKIKETGAPYDALYYLANAYRINNQLDKAIETYYLFKKNLDSEVYDSTIVNQQIQSCINAKELMGIPLYIKEYNLGSNINEERNDFYPVISDNEDLLIFSKIEALYNGIFYSRKINGQWQFPLNMNELLKFDTDLYPTSISKDGKTLYMYSSAELDGIIYTSTLEKDVWSPLIKLNDNINTKYWESHASISHDNNKLYFTSNRKGTIGGLDIYVSKRDSSGNWGPAENLGPTINTPYNEESPFLSQDDKTLFFSSRGHFNMGGYDIFYSTLLPDGKWSVPLNVGYPLNSTDDDVFFKPVKEGYEGYYAKESPGGFGKQDIYRIEIFSDDHPRKFFVRGMVKVADLLKNINDSVKISAMNINNPNQTLIVYSNPKTGEYEFQVPQGKYQVTYESEGSEKVVNNIDLPLQNPSDSFVLPGTILPKADFMADLEVNSNKTISVSKGDVIIFPLRVEPNSILKVEHWVGDSLISSEQFQITDSTFNYKMVPAPGDNKVVFTLTDKFNNTSTTSVFITRENNVIQQPVVRPEYNHVIAEKQVAAFSAMLMNRSDGKLKNVIDDADIENHQFATVDSLIAFIKTEASKNNINPEEIDKLALKVAVMDNVLTQAAVDLMAKYTNGDLKQILSDLDIYKADLKTWTDLQEYIQLKTGGDITPEELNRIAADILADVDPDISVLSEKIMAYGENSESAAIIRLAVVKADLSNIKTKEIWLKTFYNESVKQGLTHNKMSELLVAISSMPDITVEQFLNDLINQAEEPLLSSLKALDLKKEKIKSPSDLVIYLLTNKDKSSYPEDLVYKAIANLIIAKDLSAETIKSHINPPVKSSKLWIVLLLSGTGLLILLFFIWKRRKKESKEK